MNGQERSERGSCAPQKTAGSQSTSRKLAHLCIAEEAVLCGLLTLACALYGDGRIDAMEFAVALVLFAAGIAGANLAVYLADRFLGARGAPWPRRVLESAVAVLAATALFAAAFALSGIVVVGPEPFEVHGLGYAAAYGCTVAGAGLCAVFRPGFLDIAADIREIKSMLKRAESSHEEDRELLIALVESSYDCDTCRNLTWLGSKACEDCLPPFPWPTCYVPRSGTLQEKVWYRDYDQITDDDLDLLDEMIGAAD